MKGEVVLVWRWAAPRDAPVGATLFEPHDALDPLRSRQYTAELGTHLRAGVGGEGGGGGEGGRGVMVCVLWRQ